MENFRAYQLENSIATKLPDLTTSEKEAFYILQEKEEAYFPIHIKDFEQHLKDYGLPEPMRIQHLMASIFY